MATFLTYGNWSSSMKLFDVNIIGDVSNSAAGLMKDVGIFRKFWVQETA